MAENVTHLKSLYIGANGGGQTNTLGTGDLELDGSLYVDGDLTLADDFSADAISARALTLSSGLTVSGHSTLTGNVTCSSQVTLGGPLLAGSSIVGTSSFTTSAETSVVSLSGIVPADFVFAIPRGTTITSNDVLGTSADTGSFVVTRPAGGTSGLTFQYIVIKSA